MVDSETRWRLVRKLRQRPEPAQPDLVLRPATAEDLPAIRDIYNFYVQNTVITFDDAPLDLAYWVERFELLAKYDFPFLVMVRGSELLGFAYVAPWRMRTGYLKTVENSIYLAPAATGKKLGSKLFQALLDACRERQIREVIAVIADRGAQVSIALHQRHGFVEQGHLANVATRFGKPIGSYLFALKL